MLSCAVIGCGPAGMAASAILRQSGLLVTCFDMAPEPGGIWTSSAHDVFSSRGLLSPIYPSMRCVLPKELMCFSDVHFDYTVPQFPHHSAVGRYLHQYATQKGVSGLSRFNTKVESLRWDAAERAWKAITVNVVNGDVMEWSFERVCICTGQTQEVRFLDDMKKLLGPYVREGGELHHAAHVKDFRAFRNKRVVVVGDGVSAYDYCVELKKNGAEVLHSTTALHPSMPPMSTAETPLTPLWASSTPAAAAPELTATADAAVRASRLLTQFPWRRRSTHAATDVVGRWLRYRNERLEAIPTIGLPINSDGRGIQFADAPPNGLQTGSLAAECM